ncbi:hypothetical protein CISG_02006 [Coccidioides immitis RMSCC 3703]|uniref:Uncharacterized protein n=2 Tax=Coccidioides immitis TaxID=5501 RepID=A0A0J8R793_COCIT|nr:hypothetical protein CIRG_07810 [Coccidioides immitis RMSCC 2394]KMU79588.1 hypothetical protein CISG_02006 [Coccidioides immitis RMSCC 3703]
MALHEGVSGRSIHSWSRTSPTEEEPPNQLEQTKFYPSGDTVHLRFLPFLSFVPQNNLSYVYYKYPCFTARLKPKLKLNGPDYQRPPNDCGSSVVTKKSGRIRSIPHRFRLKIDRMRPNPQLRCIRFVNVLLAERPPGVDIFVVNIIQHYRVAGSETQKLFRPLTYQAAVERSSLRKWIASFADQAFDGAYRRVIRQPS